MSYEDKKNIAGETEMLSSDEKSVSRLLSNLKRVDAPKDFDFHLKARIANASPGSYRPVRLFPVLKYALPLALFLLIGAAFVLTNSYTGANVPSVAVLPSAPALLPVSNSRPVENERTVAPIINDVRVATGTQPVGNPLPKDYEKVARLVPANRRGSRGGSYVIGIGNAAVPIRPRGFNNANSNNYTLTPIELVQAPPLQFRQMLMSLGIDASDAGEKTWKVMKLTKDGIAERSGLRVDDVMEAIDDKPIDSLYDGSFSVKSISVRRDGKVVKIDIKSN